MGSNVRTYRNAVKIEGWRLSRVPIDPTGAIYQGDMLTWDQGNHRATLLTSGNVGASGVNFLGVSDTKNPITSVGVLLQDQGTTIQSPRVNVIQTGLVEMIVGLTDGAGAGVTYFPFDTLTVDNDAQSVKKSGSNVVGVVDPYVTAAGKAFTQGDFVLMWLRPANSYYALGHQ